MEDPGTWMRRSEGDVEEKEEEGKTDQERKKKQKTKENA